MHIDRAKAGKYERILLRDSYRVDGKNRHHTILNLTHWPKDDLAALELALKHKRDLHALVRPEGGRMGLRQGAPVGAVHLVRRVAERLGIADALGADRQGRLALWQVIARVVGQGSRLSAVRLAGHHADGLLTELGAFDEDSLYRNLDWLCANQAALEDSLFHSGHREGKPGLYLYDVTSSYFEGTENELAAFGYNRDKKSGKPQIVVGLLCDGDGSPVSIEVFRGNTVDVKTVGAQIAKLSGRFGGAGITLVGDRGMIKRPQMDELREAGMHYITAITRAQVERLLRDGDLQMDLFDEKVSEVITDSGGRYVCRRNPRRAEEAAAARRGKAGRVEAMAAKLNQRLADHPGARPATALAKLEALIKRLKTDGWMSARIESGMVAAESDASKLEELSILDGCYALKTDLPPETADKETIHARYKDLSMVEWAFRTSKTVELEMRPIYLRDGNRTRGHALVVMLAYKIVRELADRWKSLDLTVTEGLARLESLCVTDVTIDGGVSFSIVPEPSGPVRRLFDLAGVDIPKIVPNAAAQKGKADTKTKLQNRRKSA